MAQRARFMTISVAGLLLACGSRDTSSDNTATTTPGLQSQTTAAGARAGSEAISGPIAVVEDSALRGAKLEVTGGKALVHLPPDMLRVLSDSLPNFSPYPSSAYDSAVWASEMERDSTAIVPSVVVRDFDGDGMADVAMTGLSHDTTAAVIVLTNGPGNSGRRLLYILRPQSAFGSAKTEILLRGVDKQEMAKQYKIHVDAVEEEYIGKGSVIFYVERGLLRQIETGD